MRGNFDFSSWHGILSTLFGLVLVSFVAIGIRLLLMHGVQVRRERQNRQINERLKTLIAAYKTLGGSFTGELAVDPRHLRDLRTNDGTEAGADGEDLSSPYDSSGSDRSRRMRDAVEAALSDVILLGTHDQVRLAALAASNMAVGRSIQTAELVTSLRNFIREVLDLEAIPVEVAIPSQGPARTGATAARMNRPGKSADARGGRGASGEGAFGGSAGIGHEEAVATEHGTNEPGTPSGQA